MLGTGPNGTTLVGLIWITADEQAIEGQKKKKKKSSLQKRGTNNNVS